MTSSLFFYCGKQEDPLSQTPVVSQKVFQAAKLFQAAVWFYDTRFVCIYFLKSRFLKRHTLFICIPVDLLADKFQGILFQVLTYKEENPG